MKKFKRGDVASIYYPNQEDPTQGTERFAIVIEDFGDEFLLVPITKNLSQKAKYPQSFVIKKGSKEGIQMGLKFDSLVIPSRATQLPQLRLTLPCLGTCPENIIGKIEEIIN